MNQCDHGHDTETEVRVLPISENGGNLIVCREHYDTEISFRKERIADGVPFDLPTWESLRVYE